LSDEGFVDGEGGGGMRLVSADEVTDVRMETDVDEREV
jgi:hypothetical protein